MGIQMAKSIKKKQKREKKKKAATKTKITKQHQNNKSQNVNLLSFSPETLSMPSNYWVAFPNTHIGIEEVKFLEEIATPSEVPAYVYPLNSNMIKIMNNRLLSSGLAEMSFSEKQWVVVSTATLLPLESFTELSEAKDFVFKQFPQTKSIRSDCLGILSSEPDYTQLPDLTIYDENIWEDYLLELEDKHGFLFSEEYLLGDLLQKLIVEHQAPKEIYQEFNDFNAIEKALDFIKKNQLIGYQCAISVITQFSEKLSRIDSQRSMLEID